MGLLGYARVSTGEQDLALQLDALRAAGAERVFSDTASGSLRERPQLARVLDHLRDGQDTLVVWRLDRLGRSLRHLIETIAELEERGIGFRSLSEGIDTTSPCPSSRPPNCPGASPAKKASARTPSPGVPRDYCSTLPSCGSCSCLRVRARPRMA